MKVYDYIIIGGGPAASTFARLAAKSHSVFLIYDNTAQKPCGGLIAPDAQKMLAGFELTMPKSVLVDPQIFAVKTIDTGASLMQYYRRMYLNVDRQKFDEWLLSLIETPESVCPGRCLQITKENELFCVKYFSQKEIRVAYSKNIVGGDGASSKVRHTFFKHTHFKEYAAIQQHFPAGDVNPFYSCIFDKEVTDCCSWSLFKDDVFIFGGAYPKDRCMERFALQKQKLAKLGFTFATPLKSEACIVLRPRTMRNFCCGKEHVYLIGEAAGLISPSSLEGISSAIKSGLYLYESIEKGGNVIAHYRKKTFLLRLKLCCKRIKCLFMYVPFFRRMVMRSGLTAIKIVDAAPQKNCRAR